jgi:hypothetical protein
MQHNYRIFRVILKKNLNYIQNIMPIIIIQCGSTFLLSNRILIYKSSNNEMLKVNRCIQNLKISMAK